jgi:hypothetical protein
MKRAFLAMMLAGCLMGAAPDDDKDDNSFILVNQTDQAIISFSTRQGDDWGNNWLSSSVAAGDARTMNFDDDGNCEVRTLIVFEGDQPDFDGVVSYCDATYLNVGEHNVWPE